MKTIQLPIYVLDAIERHYKKLADICETQIKGSKAIEAIRLARLDLKKLTKIREKQTSEWRNTSLE